MSRIIAILIANFFVVDYGVIPDGKESSVYVIQIEPEVAGQLVEGYVIESVIPPELQGVRKFRIQIGNEKLTKPTPLSITPIGDALESAVDPEGIETPNDVPDGESSDIDAFPLETEPLTIQQTETLQLIPEEVASAELPGVAVESDTDAQGAREVFEPDVTILPQLTKVPVDIEVPAVVIEPVFDSVGSDIFVETSKDNAQSEIAEFDLLDNSEADHRIVLEELPDLEISSDENTVPLGTIDDEPELLRDNEAGFVRLASATSSEKDVTNRISNVPLNKTQPADSRSWPLFSITLLGLLVSVGGNVYLGMTVLGFYRKRNVASSGASGPNNTISD